MVRITVGGTQMTGKRAMKADSTLVQAQLSAPQDFNNVKHLSTTENLSIQMDFWVVWTRGTGTFFGEAPNAKQICDIQSFF
jgi:hypothetical protein